MSAAVRPDGIAAPADGDPSVVEVPVQRVGDDQTSHASNVLAVEEPLEVRLV